ncbi:hypothetical protein MYCTH_2111679 [Thermothelomyces thermophilus ATCC 42464]|uniref:Uncharacterized protein n=1 Tax=Thermothelomyces thermophilus (strain ATCC 42464 / BCRC 31852 / DSM 1799) TaxID=573729 RepID=G2QIG9_THET4|nr:uncharacterized protein MYCTH_2111679 [Thermothelomyces thermophilus ATCC 42464]AEO59501.1 hypothetical protein MYCTH_2111679 [Thermothelomyces thermophilus ATCC 42464]
MADRSSKPHWPNFAPVAHYYSRRPDMRIAAWIGRRFNFWKRNPLDTRRQRGGVQHALQQLSLEDLRSLDIVSGPSRNNHKKCGGCLPDFLGLQTDFADQFERYRPSNRASRLTSSTTTNTCPLAEPLPQDPSAGNSPLKSFLQPASDHG